MNDADIQVDTGVSVDGSWQRRGFSSLNGVVTVISIENGKIYAAKSFSFNFSFELHALHNLQIVSVSNNLWKSNHECSLNYIGSAPNMELSQQNEYLKDLLKNIGLRYMDYYGDGDSKSYMQVRNVYPGMEITKYECIGHVQKRVGCRLRNVVRRNKGVGGEGKLSLAIIDKLQNYYGNGIRSNIGNLAAMKKGILAPLFHVASSAKNVWHDRCSKSADSWFGFQRDIINKTGLYKPVSWLTTKYFRNIY